MHFRHCTNTLVVHNPPLSVAVAMQGGLDFEPSETCAVMVGHKEMCEAVTKVLESKGVSKDHILLNF